MHLISEEEERDRFFSFRGFVEASELRNISKSKNPSGSIV